MMTNKIWSKFFIAYLAVVALIIGGFVYSTYTGHSFSPLSSNPSWQSQGPGNGFHHK